MKQTVIDAFHNLGYTYLLPIQEMAIPKIQSLQNVFIQANTGSGKTLAYLLPLLDMIGEDANHTEALIICPTRELALQVSNVAEKLAAYTKHHVISVIGGMDVRKQNNALKHRPTIVIGTPGRICDLMDQHILDLSHTKHVVLDEVDQVIATGQRNETMHILKDYQSQLITLSATKNDDVTSFFTSSYEEIILHDNSLNTNITSYYLTTDHRRRTLKKLMRTLPIEQAIVFVNYKNDANELATSLQHENILAHAFSSYFDEPKRIQILRAFQNGSIRILVATDAAARGLDLTNVSHIIHYHLPQDTAAFIHRSGRSAHQGNTGISIAILKSEDVDTEVGQYIMNHSHPFQNDDKTTVDLSTPIQKDSSTPSDTMKIQIRAGRKDKIRPKDIIGALCAHIDFADIGVLEIQDTYSTVTLLHMNDDMFHAISPLMIKGKKRKVMPIEN